MQKRFIRTLLLVLAGLTIMLAISAPSFAEIGVAITFGPPAIPVYEQPICPGDGYLWTPGYWAWDYDIDDYYWVPGTWILAPEVGFLWTPGWWGWGNGAFLWNEGYWGPQIGFYGGINYGFGYFGTGFVGGRWDGGHFFYNRAVLNINVTEIHNVYNTRVEVNNNHISYNGGNGGIDRRPTPEEEAAARERHVGPVAAQTQHVQAARANPQLRASANQGRPPIAATARPGEFSGAGVVAAKEAGGHYTPPPNRGNPAPGNTARPENNAARPSATHVSELPPAERPAPPNTGDAKQDQKLQKQQEKLYNQQQKERQKVTQQQQKEDQKLANQKASDAQKQQQEQRHAQQTQQLQQKHTQQQQQMQQHVQAAHPAGKPPK
jgi:hypothetical protein